MHCRPVSQDLVVTMVSRIDAAQQILSHIVTCAVLGILASTNGATCTRE